MASAGAWGGVARTGQMRRLSSRGKEREASSRVQGRGQGVVAMVGRRCEGRASSRRQGVVARAGRCREGRASSQASSRG